MSKMADDYPNTTFTVKLGFPVHSGDTRPVPIVGRTGRSLVVPTVAKLLGTVSYG